MSSPEAEALDSEAPNDTNRLKSRIFEPFEQDSSDTVRITELSDVGTGEEDAIGEPPDTLVDRINHLPDAENTDNSHSNRITFKRAKSADHVETLEAAAAEHENYEDNADHVETLGVAEHENDEDNADLESENDSHLPSPP